MLDGFLLLDKPRDISSNQAIQRVKRHFKLNKIGHTGTLDPLATGMLPLCINQATKFTQYLLSADKAYFVQAQLGMSTTTGDSEGEVIKRSFVPIYEVGQFKMLFDTLLGKQMQVAPKYSALKYQGKPMYYWARKGIEVPNKVREVTVHSLNFIEYDRDLQILSFKLICSKGTYVRSLVELIGSQLDCDAHVIGLRRLWVAPFENQALLTLAELEKQDTIPLFPIDRILEKFPAVYLSDRQAKRFLCGVPLDDLERFNQSTSTVCRIYLDDQRFCGLADYHQGRLVPKRLLNTDFFS